MTKLERSNLVNAIFSQEEIFEKYILNVLNEEDRKEVLKILSKRIINTLLREELNFLYMKSLDNFKFSLIINKLFHEIANEWFSYAQDLLYYEQEDALDILQEKEHVSFLFRVVKSYFREYKSFFTKEIANSFIALIETMPSPTTSNELITEVLNSDFVKKQNVSVIYSYSQLWTRVKSAHNIKQKQIAKLQIKIDEAESKEMKKKYEYEEEILQMKSLAHFDEALLRLRNTMVAYMEKIKT